MRGRLFKAASLLYPVFVLLLLKRYEPYMPGGAARALKMYPVAVNVVLLVTFAHSLSQPMNFVERLARLTVPAMSRRHVDYTRSLTKFWCGFFVLNGLTALATVFWASDAGWALYNGLITYLLMGGIFGVEWIVRRRANFHDPA